MMKLTVYLVRDDKNAVPPCDLRQSSPGFWLRLRRTVEFVPVFLRETFNRYEGVFEGVLFRLNIESLKRVYSRLADYYEGVLIMKRRELFRQTLLGAIGSAVTSAFRGAAAEPRHARQFPSDFDASKDLARADWKPVFLDTHQNETLIALSDMILPKTDTPGAKEALVNRFIDRLLAAETRETQQRFLASLAYIDGECMARYRAAFVYLPAESQTEFLKLIAYPHSLVTWGEKLAEFEGPAHFENLKSWISRAYYNSEIGMKELGWSGNVFHDDLEGCPHPPETHK